MKILKFPGRVKRDIPDQTSAYKFRCRIGWHNYLKSTASRGNITSPETGNAVGFYISQEMVYRDCGFVLLRTKKYLVD